jgi:hypothetical protein
LAEKESKKLICALDTYKLLRPDNASIVRHEVGFVGLVDKGSGEARRQIKCEFDYTG